MNNDDRLQKIAHTLNDLSGENYFSHLVELLSDITDADYTFAATIDSENNTASSLAVHDKTGPQANMSYSLAGTPCGDLTRKQAYYITRGIADLYPEDPLLKEMNIEGYVGICLHNTAGVMVGILVALYKLPLLNRNITERAFQFFSASASAEIERRNHENALLEKRNELREKNSDLRIAQQVYDFMSDGVIVTNSHNQIIYVNDSLIAMSGYERDEIIGENPKILNSGLRPKSSYHKMWSDLETNGFWQGELINRKKSGEVYPVVTAISVLSSTEGSALHHIAVHRDVTSETKARDLIAFQASHDNLTGLANRYQFYSEIENTLGATPDEFNFGSILFVDFNNFRGINNAHGNEAGDEILKQFSDQLRSYCEGEDISISRLNGDQFGIFCTGKNRTETSIFSRELMRNMNKQYTTPEGKQISITHSIGISIFPHDAEDCRELFACAELALEHAKASGKNTTVFYDEEMKSNARRIDLLRQRIVCAIAQNSFEAYYQPIIETKTRKLSHFEALARWTDEELGQVYPDEFITVAEEFGLIQGVSECVTSKAINGLLTINKELTAPVGLSINRSAREFMSDDQRCSKIVEMIERSKIDPALVSIELTESMMINNEAVAKKQLDHLRTLGFSISMDDFGTGYSSLGYLKKYPFDYIKIDRSFVADMAEQHEAYVLVKTIIDMAHNFGMQVIAEGVETLDQMDMLEILNCDYVQGYLFSPPMAKEKVMGYIASHHIGQILPQIEEVAAAS